MNLNPFSWFGRRFTLRDGWQAFLPGGAHSGKAVTLDSTLALSAAWACLRTTSQAVGMLPLQLYEKDSKGGRELRADYPLAEILNDSPNASMTSFEYWQASVAWAAAWGNSYSEIVSSGDRIVALNLLPADSVNVTRNQAHELRYRFVDRGKAEDLPAEKVFHLKPFGFGGDLGLNPIRYGTHSFGNAIAADEAAGKSLGGGMMASGVLSTEQVLSPEQAAQIEGSMKRFAGSNNAGKLMVLEGGMKFAQLSFDPETMQLLETRGFGVEDVCRFFGTPPIVIGHSSQGMTAWGTGIETLLLQWLTTGLNPYLRAIEKRISKQLIPTGERRKFYAEFNREALLQTDSTAKAAFFSSAVQNGWMTRNEVRSKVNMPKDKSAVADQLTAQTNLAPLDKLGIDDPRATMRNALGIEG